MERIRTAAGASKEELEYALRTLRPTCIAGGLFRASLVMALERVKLAESLRLRGRFAGSRIRA